MFDLLKEDIQAIKDRDPAAKSSLEIFLLYPGLKAVRMYRRAHKHYLKDTLSEQDTFRKKRRAKPELKFTQALQ